MRFSTLFGTLVVALVGAWLLSQAPNRAQAPSLTTPIYAGLATPAVFYEPVNITVSPPGHVRDMVWAESARMETGVAQMIGRKGDVAALPAFPTAAVVVASFNSDTRPNGDGLIAASTQKPKGEGLISHGFRGSTARLGFQPVMAHQALTNGGAPGTTPLTLVSDLIG